MKKNIVSIILLVVLCGSGLYAHDLDIEVKLNFPTVISRSLYAADEPAGNAMISVFSPADSKKPYQTGTTDMLGYFTFIPNVKGDWIIKADDGHGHREQMKVTVSAEFMNPPKPEAEAPAEAVPPASFTETEYSKPQIPTPYKIIVGLSLIFGITGFYYGYKAKQANKQ